MHILLVEDNADDAFLTQEAFELLDDAPQFTVCTDGRMALDWLEQAQTLPDLTLLDLNMPGMGGFALLECIRTHPRHELRQMPVLILSTSNARSDVNRAYEQHANSYICKPRLFQDYARMVEAVHDFWMQTARLPH